MDIVKMYKLFLTVISKEKPDNFSQLLESIESDQLVVELRNKIGDDQAIDYLQDILKSLIDDGLIRGSETHTYDGRVFSIERLYPVGYAYLERMESSDFLSKLKQHAQENGVAPSIENITKLIANLIWD